MTTWKELIGDLIIKLFTAAILGMSLFFLLKIFTETI